ncbi:MAG: polysaccharide deacetylase family protein [Solirubrobacterales bacterium]|nr:polysaccharide deacetylase family protein [Solirubrobacterales bacterium]
MTDPSRPTLLLSVDFEDWHQLVRRRVGAGNWLQAGPALERQTHALLALFDELGARATFFVLGITARAHPHLLEPIVARGHEIGCHGDAHLPVHAQTPQEFAHDLRAARATIEELAGRAPLGYRAPAFSITRDCVWAYRVLAQEGFAYDASQHDSPRIRGRVVTPASGAPHPLELPDGGTLWEFPVAVWHVGGARLPVGGARLPVGGARLPVGGASYWQLLPTPLLLRGLRGSGSPAGLYLHPNELDPQPLRAALPPGARVGTRAHARLREAQRNGARRRAPSVLRAIARHFALIPYGEAHARLDGRAAARS